ncbi:hypothetical protein B0H63DRAFT_395340 [Podospora didyma]|uniref:Zn(2)-C6 fungal-type domain-containing protein n=1 Tax=Podospora didyma TaxID=330526 RepID=A0AAE0TZI1_9PEZI|nr:hypothetical protein B0H63DRAFT_395340 [Podospora didyma]
MAPLRLGYTKSRAGCLRCKQRRCDESRPCRACVRHGVECSLVTPSSPSVDGSSSSAQQTGAPSSPRDVSPNPPARLSRRQRTLRPQPTAPSQDDIPIDPALDLSTTPSLSLSDVPTFEIPDDSPPPLAAAPDPFPYLDKFVAGQACDYDATWVSDLELMHHFTTITSESLSKHGGLGVGDLWRTGVPKLAFVHVYLLHQILSIAASHMAYLHPHNGSKHALQASYHQSLAIQGIRAALTNISPENCHALFASSSMLFISTFAASRPRHDGPGGGPTVDDLIDIFLVVKGIMCVLDTSYETIRTGPMAVLFQKTNNGAVSITLDRIEGQLDNYLGRVCELPEDDPTCAVMKTETANLRRSIRNAVEASLTPEYRIIAEWPIATTDAFITLVRQKNQIALALLSYFCVVINATEHGYWFTQGWSRSIIDDISAIMTSPWNQDSAWALGWITAHSASR